MIDLRTFELRRVVIHDVPPPDVGTHGPLILTDAPTPIDDDLRSYFSRKVVDSLALRGLDVVADPGGDSSTREAAAALLARPDVLTEASQRIAEHLYSLQTNANSPGLLAVADCELGDRRCVSLLKLEREQGLRLQILTEQGGRHVVNVELLRDLTLTDRTRVFKTAVLAMPAGGLSADDIEGRVSDHQRSRSDASLGVAEFWMGRFLGSKVAVSPARATHDFVTAAERFLNEQVEDPERQAQYQVALLARMQDNVMDVRPRTFASDNLAGEDVAPFLAEVSREGMDPNAVFQKDLSLVKVTRGFRLQFQSGMVLIGSAADLETRVHPEPDNSRTVITDAQKQLRGR